MWARLDRWRRWQIAILASGLGAPALITAIALLPKDNAQFAANGRFTMMLAVFAVALAGLVTFILTRRRYRELKMLWRYGHISSAVRDTLSYLRHEQRLAARGQLPLLAAALVSFWLFVLAHWPQADPLAPFRTAFGLLAALCLLLVPICALRNRTHHVNAWFLRRYLGEQLDHLGIRKLPRKQRRSPTGIGEQAVTVTGPGRFAVDGFEFCIPDLLGGALITGQTGSGKTLTLNTIIHGLIASTADSGLPVGGLVLDAKGDFKGKVHRLCARYGRDNDLVTLDPSAWAEAGGTLRSVALNLIQNEDDPHENSNRFITGLSVVGLDRGHDGSYWLDSARIGMQHAICLVRAAALTPAPSLIDVYRLLQEGEQKTPFYHKVIAAISTRYPGALPTEITDAVDYFEKNLAPMADRERSALRGTIAQLLDQFLLPPYRDMFTRPSTISIPEMIDQGKILYVNMPVSERERMSRLVCTLIKLEYMRNILKRPDKSRPTFFLCDEYQLFYTSGGGKSDSDAFERVRQSNHCSIVACQNLSALYKHTPNIHDVRNLLGNCNVKIFLRQTEEETLRYASGLFGSRNEIVVTTSEQAALDGGWSRRRYTSYGKGTRPLPCIPPEVFTQLAIPVRGTSAQTAESIVHIGSRGETEHRRVAWPVNTLE